VGSIGSLACRPLAQEFRSDIPEPGVVLARHNICGPGFHPSHQRILSLARRQDNPRDPGRHLQRILHDARNVKPRKPTVDDREIRRCASHRFQELVFLSHPLNGTPDVRLPHLHLHHLAIHGIMHKHEDTRFT
jgi:hypothetical protein